MLAFVTKDRTQILAEVCFGDILKFMVNNYSGDLTCFKKPFSDSDEEQNLVRANENDSLLHVLTMMRD